MLFIKQLYSNGPATFDLPLKLTVKSFRVLGYASFEEELLNHNQISKVKSIIKDFIHLFPVTIFILSGTDTDNI